MERGKRERREGDIERKRERGEEREVKREGRGGEGKDRGREESRPLLLLIFSCVDHRRTKGLVDLIRI